MKIYSLSNVLILPIVISAILIFYLSEHYDDPDATVWIFVPAFILTAVLIFKPQIDYWWHTKYPVPLDRPVKEWISNYVTFYSQLTEEDKEKFENRLSLYMEGREFKSIGKEQRDVPEDIKGMIGSMAVMATFNSEDFLLGEYDRIFIYKHPFPSPMMKFLHSVEVNHEDGVLIFSLEHLLPGLTRSRNFFNICLYAYLDGYFHLHDHLMSDQFILSWQDIEKSGKLTKEHIKSVTGLEDFNLFALAGVNYFTFPVVMQSNKPDLYNYFNRVFNHKAVVHEL